MVRVNGMYKSGTHAGMKACALLGWPSSHHHEPYRADFINGDKHVFMVRDPRNMLVSWLRFQSRAVSPGMLITAMREYAGGPPLLTTLAAFRPWLNDPATFVLRFEDLIASAAPMRSLATYLDTPYLEGAWEVLPGLTETWTGTYSDYRTVWTQDVERVWSELGGSEALKEWGY